ncbi:J domain-containing protein [Chitinophaga sp. Ak27]|uniref:J domain-containing protein n=1 Tax=Chitinophaga sp. Ak27 TaxID=2726116 RepID=UPI00145DD7B2|nr:J domain-containing protein [Chitinophaga sp. Ak27]NLU91369.1 J domain-containing protein [Chitinophaga sp. Ak27]
MNYFKHCTTIDEVKVLYRELAKTHHPDRGGDTATMQAINTAYAAACAAIYRGADLSEVEKEEAITETERYRETLEKIIHLEGVIIELMGLWIWVSGNTYAVRKELKAAGLFYASKKQCWYYRPEEYKCLHGGNLTLEQIKNRYGSQTIARNTRPLLAH